MKFYEKLQLLRREKGLSQERLAEMLDISRQAVSKWESGQTYPEMDKLITISEIFDVTLDSLVKDNQPLARGQRSSSQSWQDNRHTCHSPPFCRRGWDYEYKSKRTLFGLPLVHVNIGFGFKKAKGIIAIGTLARGVVSLGVLSAGLLSLGVLNVGLISLGVFCLGLLFATGAVSVGAISVGAVAIGVFATGAVAIGMFSTGALAIASHVAIGDHAYGHVAVGRVAEGVRVFVDTSSNFSETSAAEVRQAISEEFPGLWHWVIRLATLWLRGA